MTSQLGFALAATPGERLSASLETTAGKFGINGTPFCMSRDPGADVLAPVTTIFFSFGLKNIHHCITKLEMRYHVALQITTDGIFVCG